jgi:uncharacterized protein (TIGR02678 family)
MRAGALATGMRPEHRAEGTAFIDPERRLSDLRFPERGFDRQLPLLLCKRLEIGRPEVRIDELRMRVRELMDENRRYWGHDADAADEVEAALENAIFVLERMRLVERADSGVRALPAIARYRDPVIKHRREQP